MSRAAHAKWLERAEYDLGTAEAMITTARFIYAVFMCQQALEKSFKALLAYKGLEVPPVHNLRRLAEDGGLVTTLSQEDLTRLDFLSQYYLNARYKEDLQDLARHVGMDMAREFVNFTREKLRWLTQEMTR